MNRHLGVAALALLFVSAPVTAQRSEGQPLRLARAPSTSADKSFIEMISQHVRLRHHSERLRSNLRSSYHSVNLTLRLIDEGLPSWSLRGNFSAGLARLTYGDSPEATGDERRSRRYIFAGGGVSLEYAPAPFCVVRLRVHPIVSSAAHPPLWAAPVRVRVRLDL